ncbi:hypothetical protein [Streptomyces adustus]
MTDSAQLPTAQDRLPSLGDLIKRSADLKRGLIQYVQGPRFGRKLTAALLEAAGADRSLEESTAISVIDQFALQHRLPDGRTPVSGTRTFARTCPRFWEGREGRQIVFGVQEHPLDRTRPR